jgi:chromosome segregation ATPase
METNEINDPSGRSSKIILAVLYGAVIALSIATVYLFVQVDKMRTEVAHMRDSVLNEITNLRDSSSVTSQSNRKHIEALREELETARRTAAVAAGEAKTTALRHAEDLTRRLAEAQQKQQQAIRSEISTVRQETSDANTRIGDVSKDVTAVRSEISSTKSELDKTIAELKSMRGDMGVQSGLIATNSKELAALRTLGERNYFEFNVSRSKEFRKIGDISLKLKKADTKRNRYTIEVVADDRKVEKKDKNINEPVQFYVARARLPYEIVVNEVRKNQIVGYLATPKVRTSR